jgi:hypothetical protein
MSSKPFVLLLILHVQSPCAEAYQGQLRNMENEPGPGQVLALRTMNWESELTKKNIRVEYRWVPAHKDVEGNEEVDQQATKAAYKHCGSYTETQYPLRHLNYISFAHISRRLTETKWEHRKNDLTRRVTHREAVFGPVIHSIFDAWHYESLWTCNLTRLLRYACDYGRLILYIMLHSIKLPIALHCTLLSTL